MSLFRTQNFTPAPFIAKSRFMPEIEADPEYSLEEPGRDYSLDDGESDQLCLEQQHEAKLESLLGNSKPDDPLDSQVTKYEPEKAADGDKMTLSKRQIIPRRATVPAIKRNGQSNIAKVRSNLHQQLEDELKEALSLQTINILLPEEQELAFRLEKMDTEELERSFGEIEGRMRDIVSSLIGARQVKTNDA
ncbi:hypothetical protein EG327_002698 [Venturia inaequalis]|uniref:Uncharacterized protein n=1 Tax=Venturia inaequalis TaxID=5025 RepID=A0A8H3VHX6_VENIN|nr:hypothetical protein EG327_002698 [Venturia inaequalis]